MNNNDQARWNRIYSIVYLVLIAVTGYGIFRLNGSMPTKVPMVDILLIAMATFRLIRLFTYDSVTAYIREYLSRYQNGAKKTAYNLISCPWCTGVWMAWLVVGAYFLTPSAWFPIFVLAMAGAGSFIQIVIWKIGLEK